MTLEDKIRLLFIQHLYDENGCRRIDGEGEGELALDLVEGIERSWESVSEFSAEAPMKRWDQIVEAALAAFVGGEE